MTKVNYICGRTQIALQTSDSWKRYFGGDVGGDPDSDMNTLHTYTGSGLRTLEIQGARSSLHLPDVCTYCSSRSVIIRVLYKDHCDSVQCHMYVLLRTHHHRAGEKLQKVIGRWSLVALNIENDPHSSWMILLNNNNNNNNKPPSSPSLHPQQPNNLHISNFYAKDEYSCFCCSSSSSY
jgi:hypothetical protein